MGTIKSSDILAMAVEGFMEKYETDFKIKEQEFKVLGQCCDLIDKVSPNMYTSSVSVDIDEEELEITIDVECGLADILPTENTTLYEIIARTIGFSVKAIDEDTFCLSFKFPSIWEPTF